MDIEQKNILPFLRGWSCREREKGIIVTDLVMKINLWMEKEVKKITILDPHIYPTYLLPYNQGSKLGGEGFVRFMKLWCILVR